MAIFGLNAFSYQNGNALGRYICPFSRQMHFRAEMEMRVGGIYPICAPKRKCASIGILGHFRAKCMFAENENALFAPHSFSRHSGKALGKFYLPIFEPNAFSYQNENAPGAVYLAILATNASPRQNGNAIGAGYMGIFAPTWKFDRRGFYVHFRA